MYWDVQECIGMHRNVQECIGIYSTVQEWSRCNTMQKFGAPNLKKGIRMYQNVLECFGMYWNVLEHIVMCRNGLDILPCKKWGLQTEK